MQTKFEGKRDKRGEWTPTEPIGYAPIFDGPFRPLAILKWIFGYPGFFLPWNVFYMAVPIITWAYFTPAVESMQTFQVGWIAYIFIRNVILTLLVVGAWHVWLYAKQAQGTDWKRMSRWLARDNPIFLFRNQLLDNVFWTFASAVPIWTAYEVLTMWLYANHYIPWIDISAHPIYFCAMMCAIPLVRDLHFYSIHRLIHWGPLYRWVHYLHHNNVNVGPFSGLAMHPVEHLFYFSGVIFHWIVPSHPIHAIFHLQHAGITPAQSHSGFERIVIVDGVAVKTGDFFHYLHHKYFECNYGADGVFPMDKWFQTFHDGTAASKDRMDERAMARAEQRERAEAGK